MNKQEVIKKLTLLKSERGFISKTERDLNIPKNNLNGWLSSKSKKEMPSKWVKILSDHLEEMQVEEKIISVMQSYEPVFRAIIEDLKIGGLAIIKSNDDGTAKRIEPESPEWEELFNKYATGVDPHSTGENKGTVTVFKKVLDDARRNPAREEKIMQTPPPTVADVEEIKRQIAAIEAEKIPAERNTQNGRPVWRNDQKKRVDELKKLLQ